MHLRQRIQHLARDSRGLSTVEYVVLLVIIVAGSVGLWNTFGGEVSGKLTNSTTEFADQARTAKPGGTID